MTHVQFKWYLALMLKKGFFLLFLVLLNLASITLADSSCVDLSENISHEHDSGSHGADSSTDCDDDSCHSGHFHHYLQSSFNIKFFETHKILIFLVNSLEYIWYVQDINKPPFL